MYQTQHLCDVCKLALTSSRVYRLGIEIMYMNISLHAISGIAFGSTTQDLLGIAYGSLFTRNFDVYLALESAESPR